MDPTVLAGMLFVLIILAMTGGFILLFPITRRLGRLLEDRVSERAKAIPPSREIKELQAVVHALQEQLEGVAERQDFTERLLSERHEPRLTDSDTSARGPASAG